jgi:hypothetical protein
MSDASASGEVNGAPEAPLPQPDAGGASSVAPSQDTNADQPAAGDEPATPADTGDAETDPNDKPKRKPWFEKRIDELTAHRREAEREAAYWRGLAEGSTRGKETPAEPDRAEAAPDPQQAPNPQDTKRYPLGEFDPRYAADLAKHELRLEVAQAQARQRSSAERAAAEAAAREFAAKAREAEARYPDFRDKVATLGRSVPDALANAIADAGPDVAYHIASNPEEARRLIGLPLHRAALELGRIDARLTEQRKTRNTTAAPPPAPTVSPTSSVPASPYSAKSMADYIKARGYGTGR